MIIKEGLEITLMNAKEKTCIKQFFKYLSTQVLNTEYLN